MMRACSAAVALASATALLELGVHAVSEAPSRNPGAIDYASRLAEGSLVQVATQPSCLETHIDYYGNDIGSTVEETASDCAARCSFFDGCKFWTYKVAFKDCFQKIGTSGRRGEKRVLSGGAFCGLDHCAYKGVDFNRNEIESLSVSSATECASKCSSSDSCKHYGYAPSTGRCSLKSDKTVELVNANDIISGTPNCPSQRCMTLNATITGTPLKVEEADTIRGCHEKCQRTGGCRAAAYTIASKECKLFPFMLQTEAANGSLVMALDCGAENCMKFGVDFTGSDIQSTTATDVMDCQAKCKATEGCKAFTFNHIDNYCHLKFKVRVFVENNFGAVSGFPDCNTQPADVCIENDFDYPGNDIKSVNVSSVTQCFNECRKHAECKFFTLKVDGSGCWLKTSDATRVSRKGDVSGSVSCAADVCFDVGTKYEGTAAATTVQEPDPKSCQLRCRTERGCTAFSFSYPDSCATFTAVSEKVQNAMSTVSGPAYC